ncbi:hypothetical protein M9Y10_022692 [Tritrichomonas musculus]|uniref:BEACH domain-containing protein n=1 Tax=Tritrichomonas musculus TaxID=1915356 RepID=A0ABR2KUY1_9EUKA
MNQSFSPECLSYIESVFSLPIPTPSPPLSYSFTNLIPIINFNKLKIKKLLQSEDKIIPELHLTFLERFPALSMINENIYSIESSPNGKIYTSIFILQSITPPFLEYGEYFETEVLRLLIDLLKYSREIAPQFSSLCNQSFGFLYEKCVKHSQFLTLMPNITNYFQGADEYPLCWFDSHVLYLKNILSQMIANPSPQMLLFSSTLITTIAPHFTCLEVKWNDNPELLNELYENIYQFSQNFNEKHPDFCNDQNYLDLKQSSIKIGMELNRITDVPFKQYLPIIIQSIQEPIFTEEEMGLKTSPSIIELKSKDDLEKSIQEIIGKQSENQEQPLQLDSISPPKVDSIYKMLSSINHPILKYHEYLFSCFSNQALVSLIKLIISEGQNLILDGNYILQTFLFYELSSLKDLTDISAFVKQKNKKSIFFTETLFNPSITIFNHPDSKIHPIRSAIYKVFKGLVNESTASFFIPILADYINKFIPYPELFTEFYYFTAPILCQYKHAPNLQYVIFGCVSHALQSLYFTKNENSKECQILTFSMTDKYIESVKNQKPTDFLLSSFLSDVIFMIFDNSVSEVIFDLIEKYFVIFCINNEQATINSLVEETIPTLDFFLSHIDLCKHQCKKLLYILFQFLCGLSADQIEPLKKTSFFDKIRSFFTLKGIDIDSLAYALTIEHFAPGKRTDAEWKQIAEMIENLEMTESMYEAILILLSHNNEPFTSIANQNAIFLIPAIIKSKFCLHFLQKIYRCLSASIPDCVLFSELGLVQNILNILNEDTDESIWTAVLNITSLAFIHSTRRNDLLSFFRLLSPVDDHTQTKHAQKILSAIPILVTQNEVSHRSIIRFTSRSGLIHAPQLPAKKMTYGFTISYRIMISNFQKSSDSLGLFKFSQGSSFIKASLYQTKAIISSSLYEKDVVVDFSCPVNKWFVLSISFANHPDDVAVFINGKSVGLQNSTTNRDWIDFSSKKNTLFGIESPGFVICHFNKAAILVNSSPFTFKDLSNDESLKTSQNTFFLIDADMAVKGQIQNLAQNSTQNYDYKGQLFQCVSPFSSALYYSKGVSFIISLFSQIDYDIPLAKSDTDEDPNITYFYQLLDLISVLIQMSDFAQQKLLDIHAFEVIAHFMSNSKKIKMNFEVSSKIFAIQPVIRNRSLSSSFVRSILLNFPLWSSSPVSTLKELFKAWRISTKLILGAYTKELRPPVILNVLMKLNETNRINDEIKEILFEILIDSLSIDCHATDIAMIISVMRMVKDSPTEVISYLQFLNKYMTKCPHKSGSISIDLVKTEWLTLYPDPAVKSVLIHYFLRKDVIIFIQFVLKNIEAASLCQESENDAILLDYCCTFAGIKCESIQAITQNFNSASLNSHNTSIFPILLGYALYSSDAACEQLTKLLLCVFSQKEGVDLIRDDESKFTLFLLVSFLLLKSQNRNDFMVELVSSDPSIFGNTLIMIDLYMHICLIEYHQVQTNLALRVIHDMFTPSFKGDISSYIDILTNFVCFHMRFKKKDESQVGNITFHRVLEKCRKKSFNLSQYSFFMYKINEKWVDFNLVHQLLTLIPSDKKLESDKILILLSFLCHPINSKEKVAPLLNKFASLVNPDSKSWIPVIYQVSKHPKDFDSASDFLNTFKQKVKLSTELFVNFTEYFSKFVSEVVFETPFTNENVDVGNAIRQNLTFDSTNEAKTEQAIAELRKNIKDIQHGFESCWNKLNLNLSYQMSPFYRSNNEDYYKRGNYYDYKLRPSIFLRSIQKKNEEQVEVAHDVSTNKEIKSLMNNVFQSKSEENELYHCRCIRTNINKTVWGTFYFTNAYFIFVTDSFKVKKINTSLITHFFWAASPIEFNSNSNGKNSIQIFLKNRHSYLFTFPDDDINDLISKGYINRSFMSSIQFFQENEPDLELDRLQLTRKWGNLEISNFNYILWLNILSGRSFLNKNAYPVFPNVFDKDNENRKIVNYSNYTSNNENVSAESVQMISKYLGFYEPFKSITTSKDDVISDFIIPPDLYFNELYFDNYEEGKEGENRITVPKWAKTNVDFLIQMRFALESGEISSQIHLWIDKIFGHTEKGDAGNSCLPVYLFNSPHLERKCLDKTLLNKINHISLSSLSNLQIIDFNIFGQSINNATVYGLTSDGSIHKSTIDSRPNNEKIEIITNISRITSSSQYFFCTRGSFFLVFSFEKKKIIQFSSDQMVSKVSKLAICDDFIAAGGSDGSVVLWNLNLDSSSPSSTSSTPNTNTNSNNNSLSSQAPIQLRRKRSSTARPFYAMKRAMSKDSFELAELSNDQQVVSENEDDHESSSTFSSSSIFDLKPDSKASSPLASDSPNSIELIASLQSCVVLVHKSSICSLQISTLFGIVVSADTSGVVAISFLPSLELCRTFHIENVILKKALITEGYGCIIIYGKTHSNSCLLSYSLNGDLMKQLIFDDSTNIVDICGIVGSVSGFDYIIVADSANDISIYKADNLEHIKTIYHFENPIKKIKYSQSLSLLMVFFDSHQDNSPSPPAILSYVMN